MSSKLTIFARFEQAATDGVARVTLPSRAIGAEWASAGAQPIAMVIYDDSSSRFFKARTWMAKGRLCIRYQRDTLVAHYDLRTKPPEG